MVVVAGVAVIAVATACRRIVGSDSHCVRANVALAVVIFIRVSSNVCFFAAFANVPVIVVVGDPSAGEGVIIYLLGACIGYGYVALFAADVADDGLGAICHVGCVVVGNVVVGVSMNKLSNFAATVAVYVGARIVVNVAAGNVDCCEDLSYNVFAACFVGSCKKIKEHQCAHNHFKIAGCLIFSNNVIEVGVNTHDVNKDNVCEANCKCVRKCAGEVVDVFEGNGAGNGNVFGGVIKTCKIVQSSDQFVCIFEIRRNLSHYIAEQCCGKGFKHEEVVYANDLFKGEVGNFNVIHIVSTECHNSCIGVDCIDSEKSFCIFNIVADLFVESRFDCSHSDFENRKFKFAKRTCGNGDAFGNACCLNRICDFCASCFDVSNVFFANERCPVKLFCFKTECNVEKLRVYKGKNGAVVVRNGDQVCCSEFSKIDFVPSHIQIFVFGKAKSFCKDVRVFSAADCNVVGVSIYGVVTRSDLFDVIVDSRNQCANVSDSVFDFNVQFDCEVVNCKDLIGYFNDECANLFDGFFDRSVHGQSDAVNFSHLLCKVFVCNLNLSFNCSIDSIDRSFNAVDLIFNLSQESVICFAHSLNSCLNLFHHTCKLQKQSKKFGVEEDFSCRNVFGNGRNVFGNGRKNFVFYKVVNNFFNHSFNRSLNVCGKHFENNFEFFHNFRKSEEQFNESLFSRFNVAVFLCIAVCIFKSFCGVLVDVLLRIFKNQKSFLQFRESSGSERF